MIKDEAERFSRIVEDLFILARQPVDAPAALLKKPLSLNEVVRDCARAAQVLAVRKGVRLRTENDSVSIVLNGDEELLNRMVLNLLDNAVKYTPSGGEISIGLARQNGNALIVVRDRVSAFPKSISYMSSIASIGSTKLALVRSEARGWGYRLCNGSLRLTKER